MLRKTCDDLDALGVELMVADDAADPRRPAAVVWQLYGEAGVAQAELERLHSGFRARRAGLLLSEENQRTISP